MRNLFGHLCAGFAVGMASSFAFLLIVSLSWPHREQQIPAIYILSQIDLRQDVSPLLTSQLREYWAETLIGCIGFALPIIFIACSLFFCQIRPIVALSRRRLQLKLILAGFLLSPFCFSAYRAILPVYDQYTLPSFLSRAFEAAVTR